MSGTTIPYGDRPIAYIQSGGAFATFEFLQYLERLSRTQNLATGGLPALQIQVDTNTSDINVLQSNASTLTTDVTALKANDAQQVAQLTSVMRRWPIQTTLVQASAIALTSGVVSAVVAQAAVGAAQYILGGTLYLTGAGSVTMAQTSIGVTPGAIETAPGSFGTGWYGAGISPPGGVSPGGIGMDLSIGSLMYYTRIVAPGGTTSPSNTVYLNARATFSGAISAYGTLICWRTGD